MSAFALPTKTDQAKYALKYTKTWKKHPQYYRSLLEKINRC